ncbi:MAG: DUF5916 domain-containing protein, partial [Candidatus Eisenbacteria bacterium]|nr:DUF5916 domain-containing protein [Candidatus Eisenbacteria bacterium]
LLGRGAAHRSDAVARAILLLLAILAFPAGRALGSFAAFLPPSDAGSGAASPAPLAKGAVPAVNAYLVPQGNEIRLDGRLDDEAWEHAESACRFRMWHPDRGTAPSETTVFKIAYDREALYFGVACMEKDPSKITQRLSRRDRESGSDEVSIYLDPYFDQMTGYSFQVSPLGVQRDSYVFNDGEEDPDWDAVWEAETFEDADGWYAEVRVPFSSIRYRPDSGTWGLQVFRVMHGRGEQDSWVTWDRETPGFVSRFGHLVGVSGIPAPRQIEVLPYAVGRVTDPSAPGPEKRETFENFGADVKFGITADLTLNATIQPDFGQVEADPAVLNLSPYETFYEEKRPFFVAGSRFFQHPAFQLFYSRRIGTGSENSRIRYAAKLTGKTSHGITVAGLAAAADETDPGRAHNLFRDGSRGSRYLVGRIGKEFEGGKGSIHFLQTAVQHDASRELYGDRASREAYTSGIDWNLFLHDRAWALSGSAVGSILDPEKIAGTAKEPGNIYGTGGNLVFQKSGGDFRGSVSGRWESDHLDLNDIGYLNAADEMNAGLWLQYRLHPKQGTGLFTNGNLNYNLNGSWLYGSRTGYDLATGEKVWRYGKGHPGFQTTNVNGWAQLRSFAEVWFGLQYNRWGTQRYETRNTVLTKDGRRVAIAGGGPLLGEPATYGGWLGASSDTRRRLVGSLEGNYYYDVAHNIQNTLTGTATWNQTSALHHQLSAQYSYRRDDTQHIDNFENPGGGIGGVSYVFGMIRQQTLDLTLRTSLLFDRRQSLEIYAQPFLTSGRFSMPRELARADSYHLVPYQAEGFDVSNSDFRYASVNLNAVYRWEYRPGSALFLVWTHSRASYEERAFAGENFDTRLAGDALFRNEPENLFLAKITYWFSI